MQRHDAIVMFSENFEYIVRGLEKIIAEIGFNSKIRSSAFSYLNSLKNSSFLISLAATKKVMCLIIILSKILQEVNLDFLKHFQ